MKFRTTEIYFSGGICGRMWMPSVMAGKPHNQSARGVLGFFDKGDSFRDALNTILKRKGGDFQNPLFTSDSEIVVIRRKQIAPGRYEIHRWARQIHQLPNCADLVNMDQYTSDFLGE